MGRSEHDIMRHVIGALGLAPAPCDHRGMAVVEGRCAWCRLPVVASADSGQAPRELGALWRSVGIVAAAVDRQREEHEAMGEIGAAEELEGAWSALVAWLPRLEVAP